MYNARFVTRLLILGLVARTWLTRRRFAGVYHVEPFLERISRVWKPHEGQLAFLLSEARNKVLACGRRWGKTDACAIQTLSSLDPNLPPTRQYLIGPTLDQARILFERVLDLFQRLRDLDVLPFSDGEVKTREGTLPQLRAGAHRVFARSGHRPRSLRGFEATHVVVDEAAYVPDSLVHDVLWPMMATTDGQMTLISTPNGRNGFWRMFQLGDKGEHGFWSRRAPSRENPHVSQRFLDVQRHVLSEPAYAVEYEAEFRDRQGAVFPEECVAQCVVAGFECEARPPFVIGVDLARSQDWTAVVVLSGTRDDCRLVEAVRLPHGTWADQVNRICGIVRRYPESRLRCDATGTGSGAAEMLARELRGRVALECVNLTNTNKAQWAGDLRALFERGAIRMRHDRDLLDEIAAYVETPAAQGAPKLGAAAGHDDLVTALMLAASLLPVDHGATVIAGRPQSTPLML